MRDVIGKSEAIWSFAKSLSRKGCEPDFGFTARELHEWVSIDYPEIWFQSITNAICRWKKLGAVHQVGYRRYCVVKFTRLSPGYKGRSVKARVKNAPRQNQIWRAMQMLKQFDLEELTIAAQSAAYLVKRSTVSNYIGVLVKHGYLLEIVSPKRGRLARYMTTPEVYGRLAPMITNKGEVERKIATLPELNKVAL